MSGHPSVVRPMSRRAGAPRCGASWPWRRVTAVVVDQPGVRARQAVGAARRTGPRAAGVAAGRPCFPSDSPALCAAPAGREAKWTARPRAEHRSAVAAGDRHRRPAAPAPRADRPLGHPKPQATTNARSAPVGRRATGRCRGGPRPGVGRASSLALLHESRPPEAGGFSAARRSPAHRRAGSAAGTLPAARCWRSGRCTA